MTRRPVVRNREHALLCGVVAIAIGSFLLYDAYEHRGRQRPFALKFLPGA